MHGLLFALATVLLVVASTYYFTMDWLPPLASERGDIDSAIAITLLVTGLVFIVTNLMLAYFGWRFQDHPGARSAYVHDNPKLEWTWTAITAGIMFLFLFGALGLWAKVKSAPPADAMVIEVTGQQFAWNVRYPGPDGVFGRTDYAHASQDNPIGLVADDPGSKDDVLLLNQLYLPQDRPVRVQIRSLDVIHSFFLPNFRVKQDAMLIEVTGQQFAWNVRYPGPDGVFGRTDYAHASQDNPIGLVADDPGSKDDVFLLNQLYLPQDRPVRVQIRSLDVIHSFFLPNFRVKQDAMPGMTIEIWFVPKLAGDYDLGCAEHCGLGHYRMRGQVHVVAAADFDRSLAEAATQ